MTKSVKELRVIAKELGIAGRWDMTREQLIKAIDEVSIDVQVEGKTESTVTTEEEKVVEVEEEILKDVITALPTEATEEIPIVPIVIVDKLIETAIVKEEKQIAFMSTDKLVYIRNLDVGALVAFRCGDSLESGMVINKSVQRELVKLETKSNKEFIIPFSDIAWVRTGKRWPRWIYDLLKGGKLNDGQIIK